MKTIIDTMKFMMTMVFLMAPFFLYNCETANPEEGDPCDCKFYTGFTNDDFPYIGSHDINYFIYVNGNSNLVEKPDDFIGDFTVNMENSKTFNIDCNITLDTLDINFYIEGTYTFNHLCNWLSYSGSNSNYLTCNLKGSGSLNIENSTITHLQGQILQFNYSKFDAWIILTLDNMVDQLKIPFNQ